jgi:hypothetical protein
MTAGDPMLREWYTGESQAVSTPLWKLSSAMGGQTKISSFGTCRVFKLANRTKTGSQLAIL